MDKTSESSPAKKTTPIPEPRIDGHYPKAMTLARARRVVQSSLRRDKPIPMVVLAADIRQSTLLMKEAISFSEYASIISMYVESCAEFIKEQNGWFDKFTGDGFLAYWIARSQNDYTSALNHALEFCISTSAVFRDRVIPDLRNNSKNFPAGVGLSIGIDGGQTYLANINSDLTIVGAPVVGAVRMVNCADPWEIVANVFLGEMLFKKRQELADDDGLYVGRDYRSTKEYPQQEVYPFTIAGFSSRAISEAVPAAQPAVPADVPASASRRQGRG